MDTPEWVNLEEVEALAKARMTKMAFDYYASGSETQTALRDNRSAFGRYRILPRILRDVSAVDTGTELLGRRISMPVIIAPMAMHGLAHPDKEPATARAAAARGVPMCVSTMANVGLDDVIAESRHPFALFQLYVIRDRDIVEGWVRAAEAAGYKALVVTVDAPRLGRREADERNRFELPAGLQLANLAPLVEKYSSKLQQHREGADKGAPAPAGVLRAKATPEGSGLFHLFANVVDDSLTWDILPWLQTATKLPVFIKGVLAPQDAVLAVDYGADGIIVSNHGGRQLDYAPTALDMLPDIVAAVRARERGAGKGKIPILMDGGVRRGTDILKALALGADAVLVGRPVLYGLAAGGQSGVDRVLGLLGEELRLAMALAGVTRVTQLGPRALLQVAAGPVAVPPPSGGWAGDEDDGPQEAQ